jgi:hypothetical protein
MLKDEHPCNRETARTPFEVAERLALTTVMRPFSFMKLCLSLGSPDAVRGK